MISFGLYEQVINQIIHESLQELHRDLNQIEAGPIDEAESSKILAQYLARILRQVLDYISGEDDAVHNRVELCNSILDHIVHIVRQGGNGFNHHADIARMIEQQRIHEDAKILLALIDKRNQLVAKAPERPDTSLAENALFTGALHEPSMVAELNKEILCADRIDFLVSFIKWSGLRLILGALETFTQRGGQLRVITTSYLGATDFKAIEKLSKLLNTEIRISYDTERTRLHAKTYVFWRDSGFSTVYIGSSNISEAAMTSGLEWNIKLSEYDSIDIINKIDATFESYWNNREFVPFVPEIDANRLRQALKSERRLAGDESQQFSFHFDITPYYYQQEILDQLRAEREVHQSFRNLVVAATGTGKTLIAAFDYRDFCKAHSNQPNRMLFVAHRKEILQQSRDCFRAVLRDYNFGSLMVAGHKPDQFDHLFVSIQSFNAKELTALVVDDFYDYIVIDEFHHAAAPSYQALLEYFQPYILMGLTATPERADGQNILRYFGGRVAAEMRIYEAIERKLLSPFHYFGVTDSVNLHQIRWVSGKYDDRELENVYVLDEIIARRRVANIIQAVERYCGERDELIGIGFCVSQSHARYMADQFNAMGICSDYLTANSDESLRDQVKHRLITKEIHFIFVVDLYNEGVDIPEINTVLFLRPTESLTVFLQQLGRGLRLCEGKEALTVLDFVGQAHSQFNFEQHFRALLGKSRRTVEHEIRHGFQHVPRGCSIQLEKQAQEYILENIRNAINNRRNIIYKLQDYAQRYDSFDLTRFFEEYHVRPEDVYSKKCTLSSLAYTAGAVPAYPLEDRQYEDKMAKAFMKLSFANSRRWICFLQDALPRIKSSLGKERMDLDVNERCMLNMFYYTVWQKGLEEIEPHFATVEAALYEVIQSEAIYNELLQLLAYQYGQIEFVDKPVELGFACPLDLYCSYTMDQILVALGRYTEGKRTAFREGVLYLNDKGLDVFFVTLNKSDKDYSPSTMYHDYAINEQQFHWQSQSTTSIQSPTGQRYIKQREAQNHILIFVREYKKKGQTAMPYVCLGLADYISHYGSAPISITWQMREPMPGFILREAIKA